MIAATKLLLISISWITLNDFLLSSALKNVHLIRPGQVTVGDSVVLTCNYDLEGSVLYSVKWYKNAREFCSFNTSSIRLSFDYLNDAPWCKGNTLELTRLKLSDMGHYTCEVSVDTPYWALALSSADLVVSSPYLSEVHLTAPRYALSGGKVLLRCDYDVGREVLYSVKWYKDNIEFYRYSPQKIPSNHVFYVKGINVSYASRTDYSEVTLNTLEPNSSGQYTCEVMTDSPRFHLEHDIATLEVIDAPKAEPKIILDVHTYQVGDFLDTNCTLSSTHSLVNLTWFHNGREFWMDKQTGNVYYNVLIDPHQSSSRHNDRFIAGKISEIFEGFNVTLNLKLILQHKHFQNEQFTLGCRANIFDIYEQTTEEIIQLEQSNQMMNTTQIHWA